MSSKAHDAPRRLSRIQSPGPRVVRRAVDCGNVDAYLATERALPQGAKDPALPADPLPELSQATCSVILCFAPASPGGQIRSLQSSSSDAVIVGYDVATHSVVSQKKQFLVYTAVRNVYTTSDALSAKLQIRGPDTGLLLGIILSLLLMADSWRAILLIILLHR